MPKAIRSTRDREFQEAMERREEFENPRAWKRSAKKNLWREWEGITVTVFRRKGMYSWCIADSEERRFSQDQYEAEEDAITAAGEELWVTGL